MKWVPLSLNPPPSSRSPLSKGLHRDRQRDHDRLHSGGRDRMERGGGGDRGDSSGGGGGYRDIGGYRDGGNKDGHAHRGDRDSYKGHYYRLGGGGGGHDRDKERGEGRDHRKGDRFNLPPRYSSSQASEYGGLEGIGGSGGTGVFDGNGRGYSGGRGRGGRSRTWRYTSGQG